MRKYEIHLSNKDSLLIDEQDYQKLIVGLGSGNFVVLKNGGIVNPSFVSHVRPIESPLELEDRLVPKLEGYVDTERKVFVVTRDERNKSNKHEVQDNIQG